MDKVRIGMVGCGVMGVRHLAVAAACPRAVPFAVADPVEERARKAADDFGLKRVYRSGHELISDPDVDAVVLATPTAFRNDLGIQALEAGKHILLEKPAAMDAGTVRRMIEARGDRVAASCSARFHAFPSARVAADFVATGVLGDIRVVHCRVIEAARGTPDKPPPPWRLSRAQNGGGILVNWGSYDLDYLLGICGWTLEPRRVLAQLWQVPPRSRPNVADGSDAETHVLFLLTCEGGAVVSYERAEYAAAHEERAWQIVGTHGSLNLTMLYQEDKVITHDDTSTGGGVTTREIWRGNDRWEDMQDYVLTDFVDAIVEGRQPQTSLEKALVLQRITDGVYESARRGEAVEIR